MGDGPYTDAHGYPLTAIEIARRLSSPKSTGYYLGGRWIRRKPKKEPENEISPPPRPADGKND